ncbi:MAG: hypothetical protein AAGG48_17570 [Planctomycetota bacterium]
MPITSAGSGTVIDASGLSITTIQAVASSLMADSRTQDTLQVNLGTQGTMTLQLCDLAADAGLRFGLQGDLEVFRVQLMALQEQRQNLAINSGGPYAVRTMIRMQEERLSETADAIREKIEVMTKQIVLNRVSQ